MTHKRSVLTVFSLGCMLGWAGPSTASCVNPGGTGGCFASIQAAVDAAGSGEVVEIEAGTYVENVVIGPGSRCAAWVRARRSWTAAPPDR